MTNNVLTLIPSSNRRKSQVRSRHMGLLNTEVSWNQVGPDSFEATIELTVASDYFGCGNCGLVLDGAELIETADLPVVFNAQGSDEDVDYHEGDYGND